MNFWNDHADLPTGLEFAPYNQHFKHKLDGKRVLYQRQSNQHHQRYAFKPFITKPREAELELAKG